MRSPTTTSRTSWSSSAGWFARDEADGVVDHPRHEHARGDGLAPPPRRRRATRPVVVMGAMRPATALSADGPLNLVNAVRVAASPEARGLGALVLLDDTIHAARIGDEVATRCGSPRSATGRRGPLGWVDGDGRVVLDRAAGPRRGSLRGAFAGVDLRALPRVDVVVTYLGADGALDRRRRRGRRPRDRERRHRRRLSHAAARRRRSSAAARRGRDDRPGDPRRRGPRARRCPKLVDRGWVAAGDLEPVEGADPAPPGARRRGDRPARAPGAVRGRLTVTRARG